MMKMKKNDKINRSDLPKIIREILMFEDLNQIKESLMLLDLNQIKEILIFSLNQTKESLILLGLNQIKEKVIILIYFKKTIFLHLKDKN